MEFLKKITYSKPLRNIARFFHLTEFSRRLYFVFARPRNGILSVQVETIKSRFYVKTPGELRILESMGGGGSGEKYVLSMLLSSMKKGDIFYDIGSHVGLYAISVAQAVGTSGQVISFEPEDQNYKHLIDNIKLNNINNIRVFKKAVGEENKVIKVPLGEDGGNFSLLKKEERGDTTEEVIVINGDDFVKKENLPIPRGVKIDVEGYEYNVIHGLRETLSHRECRIVCCEVHTTLLPKGLNTDSIIALLNSIGFDNISRNIRDGEYHIIATK